MDILNLLKQLKNEIKPDKDFMLFSKQKLMAEFNQEFFVINNNQRIKNVIWQSIYSFAFTAFVLVIIFGAFSLFKNTIFKLNVLDPTAIKAEADAIDFQIQISKLIYNTPQKSNTILNSLLNKTNNDLSVQSSTNDLNLEAENILKDSEISTGTSVISIDEALDYLSE